MVKRATGFGAARTRVPKVAGEERTLPADIETRKTPLESKRRSRRSSQAARGHPSRQQEARAMQDLHPASDTPWVVPTSLEAPPKRNGYRQKWVRTAIRQVDDVQNVSRKFREGWLPRPSNTVPKQFSVPTIRSGQFAGCIGVEGMILCEMPESRAAQRDAHWRKKSEMMAQDIEKNLHRASSAIPQHAGFGRITKTATTKVVRPAPVDTGEEMEA